MLLQAKVFEPTGFDCRPHCVEESYTEAQNDYVHLRTTDESTADGADAMERVQAELRAADEEAEVEDQGELIAADERAELGRERTELESEVNQFKETQRQKQIEKSTGSNERVFLPRKVLSLKIPKNLRMSQEPKRLPVRVWKSYPNGSYELVCKYGYIKGRFQHGDLNTMPSDLELLWGGEMFTGDPEFDGDDRRLRTYTLPYCVQKQNDRGPISRAQKRGRRVKKTLPKAINMTGEDTPESSGPDLPDSTIPWGNLEEIYHRPQSTDLEYDENGAITWDLERLGPTEVARDEEGFISLDSASESGAAASPIDLTSTEDPFAKEVTEATAAKGKGKETTYVVKGKEKSFVVFPVKGFEDFEPETRPSKTRSGKIVSSE